MRAIAALLLPLAHSVVWEVDDLLPLLTATVEAQIGELAKHLHAEPKSAPPRFQQRLRNELDGLFRDVWHAENEYARRTTGQSLSPDEVVARSPIRLGQEAVFRQLQAVDDGVPDERVLLFELDADGIARIFNESLAAATAPLKALYKLTGSDNEDVVVTASSLQDENLLRAKKRLPDDDQLQSRKSQDHILPLKFALGDLVFMTSVDRLIEHRHALGDFMSATSDHINKVAFMWPYVDRFTGLQKDVLPIYNDLLPVLQSTAFRALAAILEMSPRRINSVTFMSATMELITLLTRVQSMVDVLLPLTGVVLNEIEDGAVLMDTYLPLLGEYIPELKAFLPSLKAMDSYYGDTADAAVRTLTALEPVLADFKEVMEPYRTASPKIRKLLEVVSGLSSDVSDTMEEYLERITREAPAIMDFYDDPDGFVPLLATNLISVIRRSGLPARFPSLRNYLPDIDALRPALKRFLEGLQDHLPPLVEEMIPLAASLPRHEGAFEHLSDFLVHASIAGSTFNSTLLPSLTSLMEVMDPFMDSLNAPMINLVVFLPLMATTLSTLLATLPRSAAMLPAISPLVASLHSLSGAVVPMIPCVTGLMETASDMNQTHWTRMRSHAINWLSTTPVLFGKKKVDYELTEIEKQIHSNVTTAWPMPKMSTATPPRGGSTTATSTGGAVG